MRYFIGFLATIGLIILAFILIFTLTGRNGNGNGDAVSKQSVLSSYASTNKTVRYTLDGTITSDQDHRIIQINVGQNQTTINVLSGYEGNVLKTENINNNNDSYQVLLDALSRAGFDKGDNDPKLGDERGACPTGRRYLMETWDGSNRIQHFWTTSCGGGTFKGNIGQVQTLFQRQIPDYDKFISDVNY